MSVRNLPIATVAALCPLALAVLLLATTAPSLANPATTEPPRVLHRTIEIDGLEIFYREAGPEGAPTILLLHGFPTSSHMFRNLIPALADQFHLVAPDYPGYGNSAMPSMDEFDYTFDRMAEIVERLTDELGLKKYSIYLMDYGAPIGFRLAAKYPDRVQALIVQNGNAYEEGLREFYLSMVSKVNDEKARKLFETLSTIESKHQGRIFDEYVKISGASVSQDEFAGSIVAPAMEGGLTTEEYLKLYEPDLEVTEEVISLAMAIESQALDLYQRAADRAETESNKNALMQIANEERAHLVQLGKLFENL